MKVHIICYEDLDAWILGKFAQKLCDELTKLNVEVTISKEPDPTADINHHITYYFYNGQKSSIDTTMITHVDCIQKVHQINKQLSVAKMGICMSKETAEQLAEAGVPPDRLCFINPAQDGRMCPRKIVIGITHKTHHDFRKNPSTLLRVCDAVSPDDFCFKIMGSGWDGIVEKMRNKGFEVEYTDHFDYDKYLKLMPTLDYYLFYGHDEGSMGYLDALMAGVKTIVTPQGYHLDAPHGITHAINNSKDIIKVLLAIAGERRRLTDSVKDWTWANYAKKHLLVWQKIVNQTTPSHNYKVDSSIKTRVKRRISYVFKPVSITTLLWSYAPAFLKKAYQKKYSRSS